jgi:DNA-binding CsgD family transcriptional regulator
MLTVAEVYRYAITRSKADLRASLRQAGPPAAAGRMMLEGIIARFDGDVQRGLALLRRAHAAAAPEDRVYVAECLASLYVMRHEYDPLEALLDGTGGWERIPGVRQAFESILAVGRHDAAAAADRRTAAKAELERCGDQAIRSRVLQRLAYSAYMASEVAEATDLALAAARASDACGDYGAVAAAYSIAYNVQYAVAGDLGRARDMSLRVAEAARRAGDESLEIGAVIALYEMAADASDETALAEHQREIRRRSLPEQYRDRFNLALADLLPYGWSANFTALRDCAVALAGAARGRGERTLAAGIRALAEAALEDDDAARKYSRQSLGQTAHRSGEILPPYEWRYLRIGRILAAAACILVGDTVRGRRALSGRAVEPYAEGEGFVAVIDGRPWEAAPLRARGYARLVAAVRDAVRTRETTPLTAAEIEVLRALAEGKSAAAIATETGRSVHTVRAHTRAIIAKLGSKGKVAAIAAARKAGLIP